MHTGHMHPHTRRGSQAHGNAATHRWTRTPAAPPNCPNCGGGGRGLLIVTGWPYRYRGISCRGVNVQQKDKDGHFTGHWLLVPVDQSHCATLCVCVCSLKLYSLKMVVDLAAPPPPTATCPGTYINVCSHMPPNVILIRAPILRSSCEQAVK